MMHNHGSQHLLGHMRTAKPGHAMLAPPRSCIPHSSQACTKGGLNSRNRIGTQVNAKMPDGGGSAPRTPHTPA